jgi:hypothetical protein
VEPTSEKGPRDWPVAVGMLAVVLALYVLAGIALYRLIGIIF